MTKDDIKTKTKLEEKQEKKEEKPKEEVEDLKSRIEELENKYKRALADYQNLEKITQEERKEWIFKANENLLLHILPVLDTLMLTKKHSKTRDEGLSLSIRQFEDLLKGEGVIKIDSIGKSFDPNLMECVETVEAEEGKVIDEIRPGYLLQEKVLRAALVRVGKKASS